MEIIDQFSLLPFSFQNFLCFLEERRKEDLDSLTTNRKNIKLIVNIFAFIYKLRVEYNVDTDVAKTLSIAATNIILGRDKKFNARFDDWAWETYSWLGINPHNENEFCHYQDTPFYFFQDESHPRLSFNLYQELKKFLRKKNELEEINTLNFSNIDIKNSLTEIELKEL